MENNSPNYIKQLLMPTAKPQTGRKAWSIDLEQVWLPFFTATNVMGDTAIPHDALGAPLRLAYDKDGSVKFNKAGRPVTRLAKPISESVALVRENFTANLRQYSANVAKERKDDFRRHIELARAQGLPIIEHDKAEMEKAVKLQIEQAVRDAEAQAEKAPVAETPPHKEKELVKA